MSLRSAVSSALAGLGARISGKNFATSIAAWKRGDDMVDGVATKFISPYAQSGWAHAAVNLVSGEFTGLPIEFTSGDQEYDDPALAAWWAAPAIGHDGKRIPRADVDRWLALWYQVAGEFFLLLDDSWLLPKFAKGFASRAPFVIARPDRIRLIVLGGVLQGYEYIDTAGKRTVWLPEQVIHRMAPNPHDDWRGLGRGQVARVATEGAFLTGVYIRDLMRNNGDQGFIVVGKGGPASDAQREQIVADLRAKRAALRAGIAKDLFLTGDLTVERNTEQAASAELAATVAMTQQEIFITYGVPPSMATVKQSYSIGKDSDRYQLITATSQPLSRVICGVYATLAGMQTGLALTCAHDWDDHPVMQEVRNSRLDAALKLWGAGMAWREVNDYLGLGMKPFAGWEIPYLPFSVSPVGGVSVSADPAYAEPVATDPMDDGEGEDDAIKTVRLLLHARARTMRPACKTVTPLPVDPFAAYTCACHGVDGIAVKGRDPKEIAQWKTLIAKRRATVAGFKSAFTRVLMGARAETLKAIAERHLDPSLKSAAPVRKNVAADFEFSLSGFAAAVRDALAKQQKNALQTAGTQLLAELDKDDPWSMPPAEVTQYLAARENRLRDVPQNVFDRIKASLSAGLDAGDTTAELTSRVKAEFNTIADGEARRIAMTETAAAYGAGRDSAMKSAGVQFKQWLTSGNDNVRPYHAEANGQTVQIDEPFIVGGEELMHPGDDTGSAGNVINCHCISIAVAGPEANAAAFKSPAVQPITINLPATPPPAAVEPVQVSITLNQPGQPQRRVRHVRDAAGRITESITEDVPATGAAQP